jgi:hypothetical protein
LDGAFISAPHITILGFTRSCNKRHPRQIGASAYERDDLPDTLSTHRVHPKTLVGDPFAAEHKQVRLLVRRSLLDDEDGE